MTDAIWVSGGSGFVGKRLLQALAAAGRPVVALVRTLPTQRPEGGGTADGQPQKFVRGDLLDGATYRESLRGCNTVLHLAAATGKASAAEHERVNARGTEVLLEECRRAGVRRFVFVSTIATTFPDLADYPYARAKAHAEELVRRSGLEYIILRPTIILGDNAPILGALGRLATLPVVLMPGNGRVRVQPIHVDDVCRAIVASVDTEHGSNETCEIGGPDTLSMEELLQRLRVARTGRRGPVVHLPLPLMRLPLRWAEQAGLGRVLPVTAGQLTAFRFDSLARPNQLQDRLVGSMVGVAAMLGTAAGGSLATDRLDWECRVFARHVVGQEPDAQVLAKYRDAIATVGALQPLDHFDEVLLEFAGGGPVRVALADGYAALLHPTAALRKRLVMLLAILESRAPFHQVIDRSLGPLAPTLLRLIVASAGAIASAIAGAAIFVPARLLLGARRSAR